MPVTVVPADALRPAPAPVPGPAPTEARPRWPRLLAVAVVGQPLLLTINSLFHPEVEIEAASILQGAAEAPTRWYVVHLVAALGALLGAPAALGLRRLVRGRGRVLADTAVVTAFVTAALLGMAFAVEASLLRLVTTADISSGAASTLADAYTSTAEFYATGVGVLAATATTILFAVAFLRERAVPRRVGWALIAGTALTFVGPPGTVIGPAGFALVTAASVAVARRLA
jgi:hypothetical protein